MFEFDIKKPADIEETLKTVEYKIKSSGGTFSGNTHSGSFSSSKGDIEGTYVASNDNIKITILKKPLIYPDAIIEFKIRDYFEQ